MLAEISDKVPSISDMWTVAVSASILFWSAALPGGWAARLSVAAATVVSAAFLWVAVEQAAVIGGRELMRGALETVIERGAADAEKNSACGGCGGKTRNKGPAQRSVVTSADKVELTRTYRFCGTCATGFHPADPALGVEGGASGRPTGPKPPDVGNRYRTLRFPGMTSTAWNRNPRRSRG